MHRLRNLDELSRLRIQLYGSFFLVGLAMVLPFGSWLIFVALIPLCAVLLRLRKWPVKKLLLDFYLSGVLLCGLANVFLFQTAAENWEVVIGGWFGVVSRVLAWVLVCGLCGLCYMVLGYMLYRIPNSSVRLGALIILFPLTDLARSYGYAIVSFGPGANLSPNFNWGSLAVPAAGTPLVYVSRLVGFFGLGAAVVLINVCLWLLLFKRRYVGALTPLLILVGITYYAYTLSPSGTPGSVRVAAIHLNEKSDMTQVTPADWPPKNTDLLVLPEYAALQEYRDYKKLLQRLSPQGIAVTTRSQGRSPAATNQLIFLNREGQVVNAQDKTFLIPTGEYLPYLLQIGFKVVGESQAVTDFTYTQQLTKGRVSEKVVVAPGGLKLGSLACSGVGALNSYPDLVGQGAGVLTNSASLSFLRANSLYHVYAHNMARYQAVRNNRPFVQASRSGESYIIDRQGEYLSRSIGQRNQLLTAELE